jgi:hypothetical protein
VTAATVPAAAPAVVDLSIPDLLEVAALRVAGIQSRTYLALHQVCRQVAAEVVGLDLGTDEGHRAASMVADTMCWHVAEHLVNRGQHPHPDTRRTLADWMLSATLSTVRSELLGAAAWWRSLQRPGRVR